MFAVEGGRNKLSPMPWRLKGKNVDMKIFSRCKERLQACTISHQSVPSGKKPNPGEIEARDQAQDKAKNSHNRIDFGIDMQRFLL